MARHSSLRFNVVLLVLLGILFSYGSCDWRAAVDKAGAFLKRAVSPPTAREKYLSELSRAGADAGAGLMRDVAAWQTSYAGADTQQLRITLPHREDFLRDTSLLYSAQALHFALPPGRELAVTAVVDSLPFFAELYAADDRGRRTGPLLGQFTPDQYRFTYEAGGRGEQLLLLLQYPPGTPFGLNGKARVTLRTRPVLHFPVAGGQERDIGSFWGDARDGGRRRHQGNDIFADRGTPLLAVSAGRVTKVANGGLGGKTVWLRDANRRQSYYYAHLDSQYVRRGDFLERGDTLGTVGNTGNARTTPPHLHFGIYAGGALDPFPALRSADPAPPQPRYALADAPRSVPRSGNHYLRRSPARNGAVIRQLQNGEAISVRSVSGKFYRLVTAAGEYGYANFD